jgi:catechol-2,3-dioxygenase
MNAAKAQLGHVGLNVADFDRMQDFFVRVLGFTITDQGAPRGRRMVFLTRDPAVHHQLVLAEIEPDRGRPVLNQLSFNIDGLDELRRIHGALVREAVENISPTDHGSAWSVYFDDPEGNRIEFFMDTPWYVEQPQRQDLDFALSDEEIHQVTKQRFGDNETFKPYDDWRRDFAARMDVSG